MDGRVFILYYFTVLSLIWIMYLMGASIVISVDISVDASVDMSVATRSILNRYSTDARPMLDRYSINVRLMLDLCYNRVKCRLSID